MYIRVEASSGVPITRQIADQVRSLCASGTLRPGEQLPSVRALARDLTVNQNTILRVYERLTAEGLLEMRHGAGTFVADSQPEGQLRQQRDQLRTEAELLVEHAARLGLSADSVRQMIEEAYRRRDGNGHADNRGDAGDTGSDTTGNEGSQGAGGESEES
ncbi:MAG: GntR family transcriptional regulator [Planctomycetes bacterium]|nr:GntR family transcriptional regulator [Planctomycetota bacterium]